MQLIPRPTYVEVRNTGGDPPPLTWRHTWPERGPDFVATVDGLTFGRIHKRTSAPTEAVLWAWSVTIVQAGLPFVGSGAVPTKAEAVAALRERWRQAWAWSGEAGRGVILTRPADYGNGWPPAA